MSSESSTLRTFSKVRLKFASLRAPSDRFQVLGNIGPPKAIMKFSRNSEHRGDNGPEDGQSSSIRYPSPETPPQTINVVLFGETGVGKSSVINLIARKDIAKVSSDVDGCTMQYQRYPISFDDMHFAIFDTIGLEEPQMGVNGYLKAIEKAYELISKLGAAGGIHLLLFCMRGGRITATTQSNYRLFCECLCNTKVPIALVFTGLEREVEMEDWWKRNKTHIEHYGIKSNGHACITAVQDDDPEERRKYEKSQETIRELLKSCAIKGEAFSLESHSWFGGFLRKMKGFIPAKKSPKKKDIMKVLTNRCKLDADTAKRIAEIMDKGDKDEEGGGGKDSPTNDPTNDTPPSEQDTKAVSSVAANRGREVTQDGGPPQELGNAKAVPDVVENRGKDTVKSVTDASVLRRDSSSVKASLGVVPGKEVEEKNGVDAGAQQDPSTVRASQAVGPGKEVTRKNEVDASTQLDRSAVRASQAVHPGKQVTKRSGVDAGAQQDPSIVRASQAVGPEKEVTEKNGADAGAQQDPSTVRASQAVHPGKEVTKKNGVGAGAPQDPSSVKSPQAVDPGKEVGKKNVVDAGAPQDPSRVKSPQAVVPAKDATKKYVADGIKAVPGVLSGGNEHAAKKSPASAGVPFPPSNGSKAVPTAGKEAGRSREKGIDQRNTKKRGASGTTIPSSQP